MDIYTDGACSGNPGTAGWAYIIRDGDNCYQGSGRINGISTNNVAEATAVLEVLQSGLLHKDANINLYTDSQYVLQCLARISKGNFPTSHVELWSNIRLAMQGYVLTPIHVRAHSGQPDSTTCDKLARKASKSPYP